MSRIVPALLFLAAQFSWAACDDSLPSTGNRDDVLIIVNDNAIDSCEVGRYYAEQRGLGRSNILHVKTPANPTISYAQYEILRNQIVRELQQRIGGTPATCPTPGDTTCTEVTEQLNTSAIKYLVLTKGVPARVIKVPGENWAASSADEAGSIDGYLRSQLGRIFYPARIDGLDLAAAKRLVDRALAVEEAGWRGELQSTASKSDYGDGPLGSRYAKSDYEIDAPVPVLSEELTAGYGTTEDGDPVGDFRVPVSHMYWRYAFGLFGETDVACTGNTATGPASNFYLNNLPGVSTGKAPTQCKVKLTKGNGANPAYSELAPGFSSGRSPRAVDTVAYLGHLDNQPTFIGYFDVVKSWTRDSSCTARLCKDDPTDPAACRAASIDTFKEIDTRCIGVADGFIGNNFQSWPVSYFTGWPTGWRPLGIPGTGGSSDPLASEIGGSPHWFVAYPQVREDDGDGDSTSLWYGAHDKQAITSCYASDLTTTAPCNDLNYLQVGQKVASIAAGTVISETQYYRVSLSYRSTAGETAATAKLAALIAVDDTSVTPRMQKPLRSKLNGALGYAVFRDTAGDVVIGTDSGSTWKRASAILKLDPADILGGSTKQIGGMTLNIRSVDSAGGRGNFSGTVGIDAITLEKVDASEVVEDTLALVNGDFNAGHNQFAVGDWAATFTSRLNGAAFWGSTTHNCGGTRIFTRVTDTLTSFVGGDDLATAVWKNEMCSGGLLYGDPLYSPLAVKLNALPRRLAFESTLPISGSVLNGTGSGITTAHAIHYCYGKDFFTCDRESDEPVDPEGPVKGWQPVVLAVTPTQSQGRNISLGEIDTSGIERGRPFILSLTVTSTKSGKTSVYRDFSRSITGFDGSANSDGDSLTDGEEIELGTDPLEEDTDGDSLPDDWEINNGFDPLVQDAGEDNDGDGLQAGFEQYLGTSDNNVDSDGDGYTDDVEATIGHDHAANPALRPPWGVAPIPLYAGVGHPYHVVLQNQNGATSIEASSATPLPDNATLVGNVFDWTPTSEQVGWHEIHFGPPETASRYRVYVVPFDADVNEDGALDMGDLLALEKIVVGEVTPTQRQIFRSDIYPMYQDEAPDGKLDLSDLLVLQKVLMELL